MLRALRIDPETATGADYRLARATLDELAPLARRLWQRMSDPADDFPATHDVYLKVWALSGPRIAADFILFDESQDANAAMLQIVRCQSAQQVYVGDPAQQIYAWRGAVNAMDSIAADREVTLSESFRFGPGIAEFANHALGLCGSPLRLTGRAPADRPIADPKPAVLCRTNAGVIDVATDDDYDLADVHVIGGTGPLRMLLIGIRDLRDNDSTTVAELAHFRSWAELLEHAEQAQDELSMLMRLTRDGERCEELISALEQMAARPDHAKLVLSTAHRAKGLEWSDVTLHRDFRGPESPRWNHEEANLIYVAGTRAMRTLTLTDPAALGAPQSIYHSHPETENGHVHAT
jgi:superfamily I DNA/RNA helicase